jgi:hypothetical protein
LHGITRALRKISGALSVPGVRRLRGLLSVFAAREAGLGYRDMTALGIPKPVRVPQATRAQAEDATKRVTAAWREMETDWWDFVRLVSDSLDKRVPAALGLTAQRWLEKTLPGGTSKLWRALRVARELKGVPEQRLRRLTEGNAWNLARLPESMRKSPGWIARATDMPNKDFAEEVKRTLVKNGIPGADEPFATLTVRLPQAVYDRWEAAVEKIARIFELDIEGTPGLRIQVYERLAELVHGISEEALKNAIEGG